MKLCRMSSYIRLLSLLSILIFNSGITVIMSVSLFVPTSIEVFRAYFICIYSSVGILLFFELVASVINFIDKRKLIFTHHSLLIGDKEYLYNDLKFIYFGVNINSILCFAPGKFIANFQDMEINLGYYLPHEINNIRRNIEEIIIK